MRSKAFTLIEVVVTLMLISLVATFAYSYSRSSTSSSASKPARLAISRVVVAQQVFASARGQFTPDPTQLTSLGRDLNVSANTSTGPEVVSIAVSNADTLVVAVLGSDDVCYVSTITSLAGSSTATDTSTSSTCNAAQLLPPGESPLPPLPV